MKRIAALLCACAVLTVFSVAVPIENDGLCGIMICALPENGTLTLDGRALKTGQTVLGENVENILYEPEGRESEEFSYIEVYHGGRAAGVKTAVLSGDYNREPQAKDCFATTWRGITVCGTLDACDADGDNLEYKILSCPRKGRVRLENGKFVYTPYTGKYGDDSFTYIVRDEYGAWSEEARVRVEIGRKDAPAGYADMAGNRAQYAAEHLAEAGIYTGPCSAGVRRFMPDETVSRGEFAVMALCAAGIEPVVCASTGFDDDDNIPLWQKGYISAALQCGLIAGFDGGNGFAECRAGEDITVSDASAMMSRLLAEDEQECTADGSVRSMNEVLAEDGRNETLTRADAAILLCSFLDAREENTERYSHASI